MRYIVVPLLLLASCPDDEEDFADLGRAWPESDQGITPTSFDGNFVASDDDQVCYELNRLMGWDVTEEMKGFKVDPPETITVEQPSLGFVMNEGFQMLGVIVKGADAYNLYDYRDIAVTSDAHLHSPYKHDKLPAISHYNVCHMPDPPVSGNEGCTPGYWRNHTDRWLGVALTADFDATFRTDAFGTNIDLATAVNLEGGGRNALARHATAALLNAYGGVPNLDDADTVAYPLKPAKVIALVKAAFASGDPTFIEATKDLLDANNNLGCPLHGTPAT
jgi:hypothetical protein